MALDTELLLRSRQIWEAARTQAARSVNTAHVVANWRIGEQIVEAFYHVKLKCYVVIDLKVGKQDHGDLGQMQLYVHYYDREIAEADDNPTIGLVLCTDKNDAVVRYALGDDQRQIFTSRYQFELPSEETLRAQLRRELELLGNGENEN